LDYTEKARNLSAGGITMSNSPHFSALKIAFLTATFMLALLFADQAHAAIDAFLKIEGVDGESKSKDHKGWVVIESMSSPIMRQVPDSSASTQKRQHKPISVTKAVDKSSPILKKAASDGTHFPSATLDVKDPKNPGQTQRYELVNVQITSYQVTSGAAADGGVPMETISLNFEKITYSTQGTSQTTLTQ
jgi:type VI secretion system secreted protein Hcp